MSAPFSLFERINVLGAPDTACTTDNERGYCEAIRDCLPIAEDADEVLTRLYEALKEASDALDKLGWDNWLTNNMRAALAKARGEA